VNSYTKDTNFPTRTPLWHPNPSHPHTELGFPGIWKSIAIDGCFHSAILIWHWESNIVEACGFSCFSVSLILEWYYGMVQWKSLEVLEGDHPCTGDVNTCNSVWRSQSTFIACCIQVDNCALHCAFAHRVDLSRCCWFYDVTSIIYDGMSIYLLTYHGSIHHTPLQTARPRITKLPYLRMPCFRSNEIHIMKGLPGLWRTRTPSHDLKTSWLGIHWYVLFAIPPDSTLTFLADIWIIMHYVIM